jgi:hypothetical protein
MDYLEIVTIILLHYTRYRILKEIGMHDVSGQIKPYHSIIYSESVQNRIKDVVANRQYYMKKYKISLIIDIYRSVVFLSDGYLENKNSRFFKIINELPTELQIKIIFATINCDQTYILSEDFNDGLKEFIKKIENIPNINDHCYKNRSKFIRNEITHNRYINNKQSNRRDYIVDKPGIFFNIVNLLNRVFGFFVDQIIDISGKIFNKTV